MTTLHTQARIDLPRPAGGAERSPARPRARFVMDPEAMALIYPPPVREQIERLVTIVGQPCTAADVLRDPSLLADVELMFSGWGSPPLSEPVLKAAPNLRVVFYGAGSVRSFMTDAAWRRGIAVTSAASVNAVPVTEFTVAQIVLCLKRVWQHVFELRENRRWVQSDPGAGGYRSRVGLVSVGEIGRRVAERLATMDIELLAYDIAPDAALVRATGLRYIGLDELFATCDVVSIHTPLLPETVHLVDERRLASMKQGASLINTSRGQLIDEPALVRVLRARPDLLAILDVTDPEPPMVDCPLWDLPNAVLTPHIAGSRGRECERMGQFMVDELKSHLAGEPLLGAVCPQRLLTQA